MPGLEPPALAGFHGLGDYAFQAHRGGLEEVPENTIEGLLYAWQFSAAVPELDLQTLADGSLVCLHDPTLARTTDAARSIRDIPVRRLTLEQVRSVDAGVRLRERFRGCRVPRLEEALELARRRPQRRLYLELKDAELAAVRELIDRFGVQRQVLLIHEDEEECRRMQDALPGVPTMTWCGGSPEAIRGRFERLRAGHFRGLSQVQIHLPVEDGPGGPRPGLPPRFVADAFEQTRAAGVDLQVNPQRADPVILRWLLDLGVRWFVSDAPLRFVSAISAAAARPASSAESPGPPG